MRSIVTFLIRSALLIGPASLLIGCQTTPAAIQAAIPEHRPGDFRLGVVVVGTDQPDSPGQASRYIVDSSAILRASFGAGSTLETYPGFTRRLNHDQMNALWLMAKNLLESNPQSRLDFQAGQLQSAAKLESGSIIEIYLNSRSKVYVLNPHDQAAGAIIDALSALAWADNK